MASYDVIIIGTGGVGSAALDHLARRGRRVLGLDRFPPAHDRGSSHGQTRIIRKAYFEHADYVPLLHRAYELWPELEQRAGRQLYHPVGLLEVGPTDGVLIPGVLAAAAQHKLPLETLTAAEVQQRWNGAFEIPENATALFEAEAGFLEVEACVQAHLDSAQTAGAELRTGEAVLEWKATGSGVTVRTDQGTYAAEKLVITAGAWAADLLAGLGIPLQVKRKSLFWLACTDNRYQPAKGCPTFFYETDQGTAFYGFPNFENRGVKLAEHFGGKVIDDPLNVDRTLYPEELELVLSFTKQNLPGVSREVLEHAVCLYTMSPDDHFIVDLHPEFPQVSFSAGLSGHGFKFTSVLGELLADLAEEGKSQLPCKFLSLKRETLEQHRKRESDI